MNDERCDPLPVAAPRAEEIREGRLAAEVVRDALALSGPTRLAATAVVDERSSAGAQPPLACEPPGERGVGSQAHGARGFQG